MFVLTETSFADILVALVSIIAIITIYLEWSFSYWNLKGVDTPPVSFPFGNATNLFLQKTTFGEVLRDVYLLFKQKGWKYSGFYFLAKPTLLLFDLELIKSILTKDFFYFSGHGLYMNEEVDPLSAHLFALKDQKWKILKTKLTPIFSPGKMKMMFQTLVNCSDELVVVMDTAVKNKEVLDINDIVGRYTTDVIGSCAFGIECNSLKNSNSEFRIYGKKILGKDSLIQHLKNIIAATVPNLLNYFRIPLNSPDVSKFFIHLVKETVNYREEKNIIRKDFMHLLIQLKNNVKIQDENEAGQLKNINKINNKFSQAVADESLTTEQMAAQTLLFFLGGFETSSKTLTFCFFELATNFEIQNALRKEVYEVLAKYKGKITYDALVEMTYMDKCINETLRKYPPIPLLMRECTQTYNIPDSEVVIEKGTLLFIPTLGIHYDPEFYPNPEKFDPERFSPENKSKRHHYTWLPFGEGPRGCIGLRFGVMQTKVALAVLLKNYTFSLNSKTRVPLVMDPQSGTLSAKGGVWLNAEKICQSPAINLN